MKKIIYLSYTGMTDPLGESQVLAYLERLARSGQYSFTIISFEKKASFARNEARIKAFCDQASINWHPIAYTKRPPVLSTFIDVKRMERLAVKLLANTSFDLVHCRSYIPSLIGLKLKVKYGIPFLFDMRGFWADERIDGNIWSRKSLLFRFIYNYFKKKERQFLSSADHIVSLTQNAKDEILSWRLTEQPLRITVIPCCADTAHFNPENISDLDIALQRKELNIPSNATVISYIGSLGTWYMLDEMLAFVKKFRESNWYTVFLILTAEPEVIIREAADRIGLDGECLRIKQVDRRLMPLYIALSDFSLFFIKPAYSKKASSPVKQGELMAMGLPIVCNANIGDTDEIIRKGSAGIVLNEFSAHAYEAGIQQLRETVFDPKVIRLAALDYFSLDKGVALYSNVYSQILTTQ